MVCQSRLLEASKCPLAQPASDYRLHHLRSTGSASKSVASSCAFRETKLTQACQRDSASLAFHLSLSLSLLRYTPIQVTFYNLPFPLHPRFILKLWIFARSSLYTHRVWPQFHSPFFIQHYRSLNSSLWSLQCFSHESITQLFFHSQEQNTGLIFSVLSVALYFLNWMALARKIDFFDVFSNQISSQEHCPWVMFEIHDGLNPWISVARNLPAGRWLGLKFPLPLLWGYML